MRGAFSNTLAELAGHVRFVGDTPNDEGWLPCKAIDREDKSPSAAVCVKSANGALGRYVDKGGEHRRSGTVALR